MTRVKFFKVPNIFNYFLKTDFTFFNFVISQEVSYNFLCIECFCNMTLFLKRVSDFVVAIYL